MTLGSSHLSVSSFPHLIMGNNDTDLRCKSLWDLLMKLLCKTKEELLLTQKNDLRLRPAGSIAMEIIKRIPFPSGSQERKQWWYPRKCWLSRLCQILAILDGVPLISMGLRIGPYVTNTQTLSVCCASYVTMAIKANEWNHRLIGQFWPIRS